VLDDPISWTIAHGYPVIFATLLASGLGFPIPEDIPLVAAGVLATRGGLGVVEASIACGVFVLTRDLFVYGLGYHLGESLLENRWGRRLVPGKHLAKIEEKLRKNGAAVVFIGRFLPGLRSAVFFAAGKARIRPATFLAVDFLAALVSIPAFVLAGYLCAANIDFLVQVLRDLRVLLISSVLIALIVLLVRLRRRSQQGASQ